VPSSEIDGPAVEVQQGAAVPDLVRDVETRTYKVKPFGLDKPINMRDLNPNGQLYLARRRPLVNANRYGQNGQHQGPSHPNYPVIPDMKTGKHPNDSGCKRNGDRTIQRSFVVKFATTP
jgi:hypothetical protein